MVKSLKKGIQNLIKDLDSYDYISNIRYAIFLISKSLYTCKKVGLHILDENFNSFNSTPFIFGNITNLFSEYKIFDLNVPNVEEKVFNFIKENKEIINLDNFCPAKLYESMLTAKERKVLGQVYTPEDIIDTMLFQLFKLKEIDKNTKILDPSCGGGYFLIDAFKRIKSQLKDVDDKYIIENMLYGVDIDIFSIFLTKISLIFASNCIDVKFNISNYDYLIDSFVFNDFDIIVGNPPYIGHKNSSTEYKKLLYEKYSDVFYDKADISYCFFKKSKEILKSNGIIYFITSRYFMEALYADRLRQYLKNNFSIISLIDYSGNKVFKDAMVSPALIALVNKGRNNSSFSYVKYNEHYLKESFIYKQDKLKSSGWTILKHEEENLFDKIDAISNTYINDICTIKQGIITGLDKAFIVHENEIEKYNIESKLLKKWIKNSNISKSGIQYNNLYLINSNIIDCEENYPNAIKYLSSFKETLQNRRECIKGYRKWYELQWGRSQSDFENPKIVFPYKSSGNNFYFDEKGYCCSADVYLMNNFSSDISVDYLLYYLNSDIFQFYFKCIAKKVGNNIYEYYPNKLGTMEIFLPPKKSQQNLSDLGKISIDIFLKKVFNISEEEVNIIYKHKSSYKG